MLTPDSAQVLGQLTLSEKAVLCSGADYWHTAAIPRLGVRSLMLADGPHGLRVQPNPADHSEMNTSLPATCFPTAAALGSSWDPNLLREIGGALAQEALAQGISVILGPGVNIKRTPLCGRNFEYLSEDPCLSGALATAFVEGVQSQGIGTSLKHFAVNNQETDRMRVSADVDERSLREIYLAAFERCVRDAQPWTVMCAYNRVNGTYASEHHWLLTTVLRDEWGFDGLVVSDWGAVHDRVVALSAGLDLEMPPDLLRSPMAIITAVREGRLSEATLDKAAARVVALASRAASPDVRPPLETEAHHELARRAAAQSAVLLKNAGPTLPLTLRPDTTVAVIGEFARTPRYQGAGSSRVKPTRVETFLDEFTKRVSNEVTLRFAPGFPLDSSGVVEELADEAVREAMAADCAIVLLGLPSSVESEGFDRKHIDLPDNQVALLKRLRQVCEAVVVVLANGGVVDVTSWDNNADAILECWLGGQAGASAAAQVILGEAEPAGRLAETIPRRLADTPAYLDFPGGDGHVRYGEGVFVGYRYYDARGLEVAYPFGFGLSYTSFSYSELAVQVSDTVPAGEVDVRVSVTVTNTGTRFGSEVVQLYIGHPGATVARPPLELRAFRKLYLAPGASEVVRFNLGSRAFAYWSTSESNWIVAPGGYEVLVGSSSRDIRASARVELPGAPDGRKKLDDLATLAEWLADPGGHAALIRAVGTRADGTPNGILGDPSRIRVVGNFPLRTLAVFPNVGLDHDIVDALCVELAEG